MLHGMVRLDPSKRTLTVNKSTVSSSILCACCTAAARASSVRLRVASIFWTSCADRLRPGICGRRVHDDDNLLVLRERDGVFSWLLADHQEPKPLVTLRCAQPASRAAWQLGPAVLIGSHAHAEERGGLDA